MYNEPSHPLSLYLSEIGSRVVAESGIQTDCHHLGKLILQSLRDTPDFILQIDGSTGETETFKSGLERSVQCANAFRKMGLKTHDTIVIMAPNHIHLAIPMYAGFYLGVGVAGVDHTLKIAELEKTFKIILPKIVFCQNAKVTEVTQALENVDHKAQIITFDDSDTCVTLSKLLENGDDISPEDFKASDFEPETTIVMLGATSGTTGSSKFVAASHKSWICSAPFLMLPFKKFPTPFHIGILVSPIQWLTAHILYILGPIFKFSRLQSSLPYTPEHIGELIEMYRPSFTIWSPNFAIGLLNTTKCDLTCFECILVGGSAVPSTLINTIQEAAPNTMVRPVYGLTEISGIAFNNTDSLPGSVGVPISSLQYTLFNHETQEDISEANIPGELWLKGPAVLMCYYNNPETTAETKTKDGWLKTGDIFYKDENDNYFFVERLKMLMKYMNHQISPVEIEEVIMKHPGVLTVAVSKIPDAEKGDLPVACVVRREDCDVTAQEIKDLVKDTLTDSKQLRGGVIFMSELPMTPTIKVNRNILKDMVRDMKRE